MFRALSKGRKIFRVKQKTKAETHDNKRVSCLSNVYCAPSFNVYHHTILTTTIEVVGMILLSLERGQRDQG